MKILRLDSSASISWCNLRRHRLWLIRVWTAVASIIITYSQRSSSWGVPVIMAVSSPTGRAGPRSISIFIQTSSGSWFSSSVYLVGKMLEYIYSHFLYPSVTTAAKPEHLQWDCGHEWPKKISIYSWSDPSHRWRQMKMPLYFVIDAFIELFKFTTGAILDDFESWPNTVLITLKYEITKK